MPFDAAFDAFPARHSAPQRQQRGRRNYQIGLASENLVAQRYRAQGDRIAAQRWRGTGGEVDLVIETPAGQTVFVEVKHAARHDLAADRVSPGQRRRLIRTSEEYCARIHDTLDIWMRFDLALVDAMGRVEVIENAFFE